MCASASATAVGGKGTAFAQEVVSVVSLLLDREWSQAWQDAQEWILILLCCIVAEEGNRHRIPQGRDCRLENRFASCEEHIIGWV